MEVIGLFPTPIGIFNFDKDITDKELDYIKNLEKTKNVGNLTSTRDDILQSKQMSNITNFINNSVKKYFTEIYQPKNKTHLRITQSWANYTEKNEWHHKHEHPNSFISGVFYVQTDNETDKIHFYKSAYDQLTTPTENFNVFNSSSWWLSVKTKNLFLFPSHLTHMVEPVQNDQTRISISFNTFPVGNFGNKDDKTGLIL